MTGIGAGSPGLEQFRLDGKTALVTGSARGIGAAIARQFAAVGASVIVCDIMGDAGEQTAADIRSTGAIAHYVPLDVRDEQQWSDAIDRAMLLSGNLDILVNNAGIEKMGLLADFSVEDFRAIIDVNLVGTFLGCKHAVRAMTRNGRDGGGSIINISSVAGIAGSAGLGAYCASKGGVRLLTKSLAVECGALKNGIRVNSVHPGVVTTDMGTGLFQQLVDMGLAPDRDSAEAAFLSAHLTGHFGEPSDIANIVLFLASPASRWVTGAEYMVDGGITAS